jgi:hypothetical protein
MSIRQPLRKLLPRVAIAGVIVSALFAVYVGFLLASPYDAKAIPAMCTTAASHFPGSRTYDLPGLGTGAVVTSDSSTVVLLMANYGARPFAAHVYVVDRATSSLVRRFDFHNDEVAASIQGGVVYLFNDAIGYFFDASTGVRLPSVVESDNYREVYTSGGQRYLQTSFDYYSLGPGLTAVLKRHLTMGAVADGCVIS